MSQSNTSSMYWAASSEGAFDEGSVIGGFSMDGFKKLYVVRISTSSGYCPGYLKDSESEAVAVADGKVITSSNYETLVNPDDIFLEWIVPDGNRIPTGAVVADEGKKVFIARTKVNGDFAPGVMVSSDGNDFTFIADGSEVIEIKNGEDVEVLCVNTVTPQLKKE